MEQLSPTPAAEWKSQATTNSTDLLLPSGNVARIKRLSPEAFVKSGVIPDPLTEIIKKAIAEKQGMPPSKLRELAEKPENAEAALELFDRVLSYVMVTPSVMMPPPCVECNEYYNVDARHSDAKAEGYHPYKEGERRADVLYADVVDMTDKVFIFRFVMTGVRDLETFRQELDAGLGNVLDVQDPPDQAEQPA